MRGILIEVPNSKLTDIHHVGLTVSDIEVSIRFYRDLLGMTLVRRREADADYVGRQTGYPDVHLSVASFKTSPESKQSLEVVQYRNHAGENSDPATNRPGNSHLCFQITDLASMFVGLKAQGVHFRSEPVLITSGPNQGGLVVYMSDPDGYTIELFQTPEPQ